MRLIKINDVILNMDNIAMIRGSKVGEDYGGGIDVYVYSAGQKFYLGKCDSEEEYQQWVDMVYAGFSEQFLGETVTIDDEDRELWK